MSNQIELVRNDTLPNFGGEVDFDLSGYTVTLHIKFPIVLVKTATISIISPTSSTFQFVFSGNDLSAIKGSYEFEISFDNGSGGIITYKEDENMEILRLKLKEEIA